MHTHNLSQHVHRIGIHFPSAVVATICMERGLYLTATGKVVPIHGVGDSTRSHDPGVSQIMINTEARDALKDLFPNIPDNDLNQIIKTAFQKVCGSDSLTYGKKFSRGLSFPSLFIYQGQRKVGTALELPLARRAQLAVVAHIRHVYTDYDRLLKVTSFHEARTTVEEPTLAKLVEWRGDDENGKTVLEDVFREVIVISDDDDDSDSDEGENIPPRFNRDHSVEYVSGRARAVELPTGPTAYADPNSQRSLRELSEDEAPPGFRVIPRMPKKNKIDRRGFNRYQAWDRALNRYRNSVHGADQDKLHGGSTDQQRSYCPVGQPVYRGVDAGAESRNQAVPTHLVPRAPLNHVSVEEEPILPLVVKRVYGKRLQQDSSRDILTFHEPYEVHPLPGPSHQGNPNVIQMSDDMSLKRVPVSRDEHASLWQYNLPDPAISLNPPQRFYEGNESQFEHQSRALASSHSRNFNTQDRALPSIESPSSQETRRPKSARLDGVSRMVAGNPPVRSVTPQRLPCQDVFRGIDDHSSNNLSPKRRRMAYYGPVHKDSRSGNAPGAVDSVVSGVFDDSSARKHYIPCGFNPSGQPLAQDDSHLRRNYVAPVDPPHGGRWPQGVHNPPAPVVHVNSNPHVSLDQRRVDNRVGHAVQQQPPETYPGLLKQPSAHLSVPNHTIIMDDNTAPQALHSSGPGIPRVYEGHGYSVDGLRSLEMHGPAVSSWKNQDSERFVPPQDVPRRKRIYADDFVRPVGLDEPEPLEYTMHRPRFQTQRVAGTFSHPARARIHNDMHRDTVADARIPMTHDHRRLDHRAAPSSQEYAAFGDQNRATRGNRVPESSFVTRPYDQRYGDPVEIIQYGFFIFVVFSSSLTVLQASTTALSICTTGSELS